MDFIVIYVIHSFMVFSVTSNKTQMKLQYKVNKKVI